jgi:hypothetical protein
MTQSILAFLQLLPSAIGTSVLGCFLWMYALWLFYLAVVNLWGARRAKKLSKFALILGSPLLLIGGVLDVLCNLVVCTVLFLETPKEYTVTKRLGRLSGYASWRGVIARFICGHLLDPFDPSGCHCHVPEKPTDSA